MRKTKVLSFLIMLTAAVSLTAAGCGSTANSGQQAPAGASATAENDAAGTLSSSADEAQGDASDKAQGEDLSSDASDLGDGDEGTVPAPEDWSVVASSADAAKGAGLENFDVEGPFSVGDIEYPQAQYSFLDGVAQAYYEGGASALYIRKGTPDHTAPISDRNVEKDPVEFPEKWTQNIKGLEVTCYGMAKNQAIVVTWKNDEAAYAITSQGLGGEEVPMDADDINSIVNSIQ